MTRGWFKNAAAVSPTLGPRLMAEPKRSCAVLQKQTLYPTNGGSSAISCTQRNTSLRKRPPYRGLACPQPRSTSAFLRPQWWSTASRRMPSSGLQPPTSAVMLIPETPTPRAYVAADGIDLAENVSGSWHPENEPIRDNWAFTCLWLSPVAGVSAPGTIVTVRSPCRR